MQGNLTTQLALRAQKICDGELPDDIRDIARLCLLDFWAVAIAGTDEAPVPLLLNSARGEGAGPCSIFGESRRVSAMQAALINGCAGHALDYDDVHMALPGHVSVALLPAMLSLAQERCLPTGQLLKAFVGAFEATCCVARLVGPRHYERGFHSTATFGALGAALGCSLLLELSIEKAAAAIGIAASLASGLKIAFGTDCKPLQAGRASQNGLLAALLAAEGMSASADVLGGAQGFAAVFGDQQAPLALEPERSGHFHIRENLFKFHASCYGTQGAIEAAKQAAAGKSFRHGVRRVVLHTAPINDKTCNIAAPRSATEAKFSLPLMVAYAIAGIDTSKLSSFEERIFMSPEILALREKVEVKLDQEFSMTKAHVRIYYQDRTESEALYDAGLPEKNLRHLADRLIKKFHALTEFRITTEHRQRLVGQLINLEEQGSIDQIFACNSNI